MVINPTTNRLYLQQSPTSGSGVGGILEVNLATLLTQVISPGRRLGAIAVDTTTNKIYTLDKNNGQVVVLK
jgi:DNA-binding beta-propeller fold protein YncE